MTARRWRAPAATAAAAATLVLAGCSGGTFSKRELVVYFTQSATDAQRAGALHTCTGVADNTTPEPIRHSSLAASRVGEVRFRIDHASDRDVAHLQACLAKQPGVVGTQDTAMSGS